jgi:CelD/BcsL family acetyltransferase involved in cellulose biosynthesis
VTAVPNLEVIELALDDPRWTELTRAHGEATIFHSPSWARVLAETYRYRAFALGLLSSERLVGLVPLLEVDGLLRSRRWVSLPFTDTCPPLLAPEMNDQAVVTLVDRARREAAVSAVDVHAPIHGALHEEVGVEHVLALEDDPATLERGFASSHRRNLKQADRNGVSVRIAGSAEDLTRAYYALHVATRRRQGIPTQPRSFFRRLWELVIEPGDGFLLLAEHDSAVAAGAVFLAGSRTLVYKYGASVPAQWRLRPNNPIFRAAIEWACAHGCTRLDFGRTDAHNEGLRRFKAGFGAEESPLIYSRIGEASASRRPSQSGGMLSFAIRNSPEFVCRAIGMTLYRYAA